MKIEGESMILALDYEELNSIIKCYITETLGLVPSGDANIVCENTDYGQTVVAEILVDYVDCNEDDSDDGDLIGDLIDDLTD